MAAAYSALQETPHFIFMKRAKDGKESGEGGGKKGGMKEEKEKNEKTEKEGLTRSLPFMLQRASSLPKKVKLSALGGECRSMNG